MSYAVTSRQVSYQISGFDRINFVGDITDAIAQNEHCRIVNLAFDCDGVRADGRLTILADDERHLVHLPLRLKTVRGLVSVKPTNYE